MKKIFFVLGIIVSILVIPKQIWHSSAFAEENNIPKQLNECLKIETGGNDNFVFSPDGKNFAYNFGKDVYKNGNRIIKGQKEIVGISFSADNESINIFSNTEIGYVDKYPNNLSNNKEFGKIFNIKTSKDGKSYAFVNSFLESTKTNGFYTYVIKDGKKIGPFDSVIDMWYDENGDFSYEYSKNSKYCINNNGTDNCDEVFVKSFKDKMFELYKKESSIIPVYFDKNSSGKYFKVNNMEVGPFNVLDSSNIQVTNDKSKFAITAIPNYLLICDFNLKIPSDLNYAILNDINNSKNNNTNSNILTPNDDVIIYNKELLKDIIGVEIKNGITYFKGKEGTGEYITNTKINSSVYDSIGRFYISDNGKKTIFFASKDGKNIIVEDFQENKNYYNFTSNNLEISNDGKGIAFTVFKNDNEIVVKNFAEINDYEKSWQPKFSDDNNGFAFLAKKDGKTIFIKNSIENKLDYDIYSDVKISGNLDLFYIGIKDGKKFIVKNNKKISSDYNDIDYLNISNDGKKFGFIIIDDKGKQSININNKFFNKHDSIDQITFDSNVSNVAFTNKKSNGKENVILNGEVIDKIDYDHISGLTFGNNSKNIFYIGKTNDLEYIMKNGKKVSDIGYGIIKQTFLSKDGNDIYFVAEKNGKILIFFKGNEYELDIKEETSGYYDYFFDEINTFYIGGPYTTDGYKDKNLQKITFNLTESKLSDKDKSKENSQTDPSESVKYSKQIKLSKLELRKNKKEKYITKIDKITSGTNKEILKKIFSKIQKLKTKNDIIKYLEAKIYFELK